MGLRERKKTETEQQLMYTAIRLFAERGFHNVTVADIAAEANVSVSTFFRYFDSKASAVFGLAPYRLAALRATLDERPPQVSVLDAARDFFLLQAEGIESEPDVFHAQQELIKLHGPLAAENARLFDAFRDLMADALRGESLGRSSVEDEMIASASVSAAFTTVELWHEQGGDLREIFGNCWRLVERMASP
jgi:AcrR family transcriptional regulator